ncbi:MAG TPA: polyamine ABC transporter ATP-binding protein [Holosporales bacterium]|nr:polyamine ABC transporter ATP-binding protein [Holosporales bacterium]
MRLEPWQDPHSVPYVEVKDLSKSYEGVVAVNSQSLEIYKGELFSLLGPSGCGKSTLLRMLAGFEEPSEGHIYIDGVDITHMPPYERPVNMMFQAYALFPHMTVEQNVAFGLKQEGVPKDEIRDRVSSMLHMVRLNQYASRKPHQLSGGQRQRVALARCLVKKPKLVLLDEPLGALDRQLRIQTQFELVNIQEELGVTFIMVTHDQEEAMTMSTRIGVMEEGRLRQIGTPTEIYEYPNSRYVADFVGDMNMFEGIVTEIEADHVCIHSEEVGCDIDVSHVSDVPPGATVAVAIRPEKIMLSTEKKREKRNTAKGVVNEIAYLGDMSIYHVLLETGKAVRVALSNQVRLSERPVNWDDEVYLSWHSDSGIILTG